MMRIRQHLLCFLVLPIALLTLSRNARASGTEWYKVTTPHFELYTDLDAQTAGEAGKELETTRDALITAAWPAFSFPDVVRTRVFVLRDGLDFERMFGRHIWGFYVGGTRPAFYLYGPPSQWAPRRSMLQVAPTSVLRHEMTHQLAAAVFRRAPRWFKEGLAQFLETVQITQDGKSIVVGGPNRDGGGKFFAGRTVTLRRALEWDEANEDLPESEVSGLYGTSWAWFHWLYNNRQEPFSRYQFALAKGVNPKKAWDAAFPGINPDAYDRVLYDYVTHGQGAVDTLPLRTSAPSIDVKAMSAADGHAMRARLALRAAAWLKEGEDKAQLSEADAELKKALDLDPTCVDALLLTSSIRSDALLKAVRAAAAAHPDDSRIHRLLGDILNDRDEREAAYRRALQIDHDDPEILDALARLLVAWHRADEAFPLALRASQRAPYDFNVTETFAQTLYQRGRCRDAVQQQQRAADRAKEAGARATSIVQRLEVMKAACKASGALPEGADLDASVAMDETSAGGAPGGTAPLVDPKIMPHNEGIFSSATVGFGYGFGSYESTTQLTTPSNSFNGGGVDLAVALGYGFTPAFVLAAEVGLFAFPAFTEQITFNTGAFVTDLTMIRVGLLTDVHPWEMSPLHLQAGFDFVRGSWNGSPGPPDSPQLPIDEFSLGFLAHASAGLVWRVHGAELGPSLRVHYGSLGSEHTDATLLGVTALFGFYL